MSRPPGETWDSVAPPPRKVGPHDALLLSCWWERRPGNPYPTQAPSHYVDNMATVDAELATWAAQNHQDVPPGGWRVRVHPAVVNALGPETVGRILGDSVRAVEAPPLSAYDSPAGWFEFRTEDQDQSWVTARSDPYASVTVG